MMDGEIVSGAMVPQHKYDSLTSQLTVDEIALFDIEDDKAHGPDDLVSLFQKNMGHSGV